MSYTTFYFLRDKFLGQGEREQKLIHGQFQPPESVAYFCPLCGEVWARAVVDGIPYHVWCATCERHGPRWASEVPGSFWLLWDRAFNDALPAGVVTRELRLALDHAEWLLDTGRTVE